MVTAKPSKLMPPAGSLPVSNVIFSGMSLHWARLTPWEDVLPSATHRELASNLDTLCCSLWSALVAGRGRRLSLSLASVGEQRLTALLAAARLLPRHTCQGETGLHL